MYHSDRTTKLTAHAGGATGRGCSDVRDLEDELTRALRGYSSALKAARQRGFLTTDADTEEAGERVLQAWFRLGEDSTSHGCG